MLEWWCLIVAVRCACIRVVVRVLVPVRYACVRVHGGVAVRCACVRVVVS